MIPLAVEGAPFGALALSFTAPREFDAQEQSFLVAAAQWYLQLDAFTGDQVLEHRLRTAGPHA